MSEPRQVAQQVLETIESHDAYSHIALDVSLERSDLDARDRGLTTELVYGTLTWQRALDGVLDDFVRGGVKSLDQRVLVALRVAAYQLLFLDRIPAHAAVDEAVEIIKRGPSRKASGLVNAVLRNIVRQKGDVQWWSDADRQKKPVRYLGERYSLPNWIANRMLQKWGLDRAERYAEAFTRRPPLYLRSTRDIDPAELPDDIEAVEDVPGALRAESMTEEVRAGLEDGRWVVQDLGSQLVSLYSGAEPEMVVLDGCAGLGGKALHLARQVGASGGVVAVDPADTKIQMLCSSAEKIGLTERLSTHVGTLQSFAAESDDTFELVLIDAPCSGLGVMRRHPETRWRRSEADIRQLVELQRELLDAAADLVDPGGVLAYSVCTFTNEEGPKQVDSFLERHDGFRRAGPPEGDIPWQDYVDDEGQLRLTPAEHDADAFFAVRVRKE